MVLGARRWPLAALLPGSTCGDVIASPQLFPVSSGYGLLPRVSSPLLKETVLGGRLADLSLQPVFEVAAPS